MQRLDTPDQVHETMLDVHRGTPQRGKLEVKPYSVLTSILSPVGKDRAKAISDLRKKVYSSHAAGGDAFSALR